MKKKTLFLISGWEHPGLIIMMLLLADSEDPGYLSN